MAKTYEELIEEVLCMIYDGQHLRFVNDLFRTKEVCLEAVKYESNHSIMLHDIYSVPIGNIDFVFTEMKEYKKSNDFYLEKLTKAYNDKKLAEKEPGYYGNFKDHQELLSHFKAPTHDEMLRIRFDQINK